jgi:methionyl-tRNA formyltransferase
MTVVSPLRVAFAGTPQFAVPALEALLASRHTVVGVVTQPDRPKGRGRQLAPSPIKQLALGSGLVVTQPHSLRTAEGQAAVAALAPDVMVVVAYGQILPRAVLQLPRLGCVNIHASLLPRWRGAAPIQRAILAGDTETGVTLMQMDDGLDTGGILAVHALPIGDRDTSTLLHDRLATLGAQALLAVLEGLAEQRLQARPQSSAGITYAQKIRKSEAPINWSDPAAMISRQIRAFDRWPVAETTYAGEPVRIHGGYAPPVAAVTEQVGAAPGAWLGLGPGPDAPVLRVACGSGELHITQLQRAGRKVVAAHEFVNGLDPTAGHFG